MAKGTGFAFFYEHLLHHLNQLIVLQDLFDDMGMRLPVKFPIGKTALSTHCRPPKAIISLLSPFDNEMWVISANRFWIARTVGPKTVLIKMVHLLLDFDVAKKQDKK